MDILEELKSREPIFHRMNHGTTRDDFKNLIDPSFREVGASGRSYSREYVLDVLEERYLNPVPDSWESKDFHCLEIAGDSYLLTYTLIQGERVTRRATIWRRTADGWRILYHQGTIVQDEM